jgi:Ca2+-binding EF-hand superfamily protein
MRWIAVMGWIGAVSLPAAIQAADAPKPPLTPEAEFKAKDENKDGKLTVAEFTKGESPAWVSQHKQYFAAIDKNKDGVLTMAEFKEGAMNPPDLRKKAQDKKKKKKDKA